MRVLSNSLCCAALMFSTILPTFAQDQTQSAPIPSQILTAKKIFISNAGADADVITTFQRMGQSRLPYERFYSEMKKWGRYELVSAPADADLVFEIRFSAPISSCNEKLTVYMPQYGLSIVDVRTHFTLWSLAEPVQPAYRKVTFEKNLDQGMASLMANLKQISAQVSVEVAAKE
jgi:hypothetical protein